MADIEAMVAELDDLLKEYDRIEHAQPRPSKQLIGIRLAAALDRLAETGSVYARQAQQVNARPLGPDVQAFHLSEIARALRDDLRAGYVQTFTEKVHAEVFSDFLGMAGELQASGYQDAAAVIAGSVLEDHLRKLAAKIGVHVEKGDGSSTNAEALNSELTLRGAYSTLDQKCVTHWLDLRDNAAHGRYGEYDQPQIAAMVRDVRAFLGRHPA